MSKSHAQQWTIVEEIERPPAAAVSALAQFTTTQIADCGGPVGVVEPGLGRIAGGAEFCGPAVTEPFPVAGNPQVRSDTPTAAR
jgi:4-hydroxy-4-methyl-2-oxoglutarate aldolase